MARERLCRNSRIRLVTRFVGCLPGSFILRTDHYDSDDHSDGDKAGQQHDHGCTETSCTLHFGLIAHAAQSSGGGLMKRRSNFVRTIPPWWANPIVFIPGSTALAIVMCGIAVIYAAAVLS